jgi:AraC-like DNA-binding protein/mannose-6-phosphate isomerase-like protein (cupin superfamily)
MTQALNFFWGEEERVTGETIVPCFFLLMRKHTSLPLLIRQEHYQRGLDTGLHRHEDFYALYVVQRGQGTHVIDTHPYMITKGDVYILTPGSVHAYHEYKDLSIDAFYFQPQLFSHEELGALENMPGFWHLILPMRVLSEVSPQPCPADQRRTYDHRFHLSPERYHNIQTMIEEIQTEFLTASPEAAILTHSQFFRMLVYIARQHRLVMQRSSRLQSESDAPLSSTPHGIGLARVLQMCEEHFHEPLTVSQLAALMFLSPSRFTEIFTRQVGVSPAAYIRRLRLERAQTLLRTTTLSITTIAQQVGFSDLAQFTRAFQAVFHITPTAYRAQFKWQ